MLIHAPKDRNSKQLILDLHSITWTLRISLDGPVRLLALNYLTAITFSDINPALVVGCFGVLVGCVKITNDSAFPGHFLRHGRESNNDTEGSRRRPPAIFSDFPIREKFRRSPIFPYFEHNP